MPVTPAVASPGAVPASFELKSTQLTLVALVVKSQDLATVAVELVKRFGPQGESPDFFATDGLVIDFSQTEIHLPHPQWGVLMNAFTVCGLVPIAARGLDPASLAVAQRLGLTEAPPELRRAFTAGTKPAVAAPTSTDVSSPRPDQSTPIRETVAVPTMVITKPLRSGQKVYARGGDLVVLAMVNRGAEVIADGNIHVYAPLRGKAMAGARGNTSARIFSLCLEPELVSIAGVYRTTEQELAREVLGKAAQVSLSNDGKERLIIEALRS